METASGVPDPPFYVDLDHTLLRTDLLYASLFTLLKRNPLYALAVPSWFRRGKAHLKSQIAARVTLDAATLPYHEPFLSFLRAHRTQGRRMVLATVSDRRLAQAVADHLGLFDEVVASDGRTTLAGAAKCPGHFRRFPSEYRMNSCRAERWQKKARKYAHYPRLELWED